MIDRWERLQPVLGGPLDPFHLDGLKRNAAWAKQYGCRAIKNGGRDEMETVVSTIQMTGALEYARAQAHRETRAAEAAIGHLPNSVYRDALLQLCVFAVDRRY